MKLQLDINAQNAIFAALTRLDGNDQVVPQPDGQPAKVVRVPYKLGGLTRRAIVKNINVLRASLTAYEEAHKDLFREVWPDAEETAIIKKEDDPFKFKRFAHEQKKMLEQKDELELIPLSAEIMFGDDNEFPNEALAVLDQHGMIEEKKAAAAA